MVSSTLPQRWSVWAVVGLGTLCSPASAAADSLQAFIANQRGDCQGLSVALNATVENARQVHTECYMEHFEPGGGWLGSSMGAPCAQIGSTFQRCYLAARSYCQAVDRRDRDVATCYARAEAREMARLSEARARMPGVDEALSATGALNDLRAHDSRPAHQLSARLTEHALDMLGDQTSRTLDDFTRAFEQFERTSPGQNFIEHYARERAFIPGGSNSGPPPEPGALTPELQQLLNLATEVMERDYELPFGNQSTLSDAGREWFAEAVRAALDGDPSLLRTGGDPGAIAALRLQRTQTAQNEDENPSFDTRAAQQHLTQAEQATARAQNERQTTTQTGVGRTETRTQRETAIVPNATGSMDQLVRRDLGDYSECLILNWKNSNQAYEISLQRLDHCNFSTFVFWVDALSERAAIIYRAGSAGIISLRPQSIRGFCRMTNRREMEIWQGSGFIADARYNSFTDPCFVRYRCTSLNRFVARGIPGVDTSSCRQ